MDITFRAFFTYLDTLRVGWDGHEKYTEAVRPVNLGLITILLELVHAIERVLRRYLQQSGCAARSRWRPLVCSAT